MSDREPPGGGNAGISGRLRILVVERHSLVAAAIGRLLADSPLEAAVETVLDSEAALAALATSSFDLVLCELSFSRSNATATVSDLAALYPDVPLVLLSSAEEEPLLLNALTSGATGFFTKDCGPDEFLDGIISALRGHYTVSSKLKPNLVAHLARSPKPASSRR